MFKVTKKPKTPNLLWDVSGNCPLCRFTNGVFETDDEDVARQLAALGYLVDPEPPEKEPELPPNENGGSEEPPAEKPEPPQAEADDQGEPEPPAAEADEDEKKSRKNSRGK